MKPKYNDNVKLSYMDSDSFVMHNKTNLILIFIKTFIKTFNKILIKIFLMMLTIDLILQIMK